MRKITDCLRHYFRKCEFHPHVPKGTVCVHDIRNGKEVWFVPEDKIPTLMRRECGDCETRRIVRKLKGYGYAS